MTVQRYDIESALYEFLSNFFKKFFEGVTV